MTLEDPLRQEAFELFGRLIIRSDPSRLESWAGLGLTMTQLRVLSILHSENGLSAGSLAERLGVTPSTLTRIMDRLVRNHLVQREADSDDRRLVRHCLTKLGAESIEELRRSGRARMNEIFNRLTDEQLRRIVVALEDLTGAADAVDQLTPFSGQAPAKVSA